MGVLGNYGDTYLANLSFSWARKHLPIYRPTYIPLRTTLQGNPGKTSHQHNYAPFFLSNWIFGADRWSRLGVQ